MDTLRRPGHTLKPITSGPVHIIYNVALFWISVKNTIGDSVWWWQVCRLRKRRRATREKTTGSQLFSINLCGCMGIKFMTSCVILQTQELAFTYTSRDREGEWDNYRTVVAVHWAKQWQRQQQHQPGGSRVSRIDTDVDVVKLTQPPAKDLDLGDYDCGRDSVKRRGR